MAVPVLVTAGRKISRSQGINATSITIDTPSGIQVGDLLIAFISLQSAVTSASALQLPAGWTRIDRYVANLRCVGVAIKPLRTADDVAAQPLNQTWVNGEGSGNARYSGAIYRITGANLDAPLDGQAALWATGHSAAAGDFTTLTTSTAPAPDSLGVGMFYAHTSAGSEAAVMAGGGIVEQFTATDQVSTATSALAVFTTDDASRAKILPLASGTYATSSGMQLSIASANPPAPDLGLYRIDYAKDSLTAVATSITLTADSSMQVGDWALATVAVSAPGGGDSVDTPSGWTLLFYEGTSSGTYKTYFFTKQITDGVKNFTFTLSGGSVARGLMGSLVWLRGCAPPSKWTLGALRRRDGSAAEQTIVRAPGIITTKPNTLVLSFAVERTTASETAISGVTGEASEWFFVEQKPSSVANTTLWWGSQVVASPRATTDTVVTYPNPQTINGWGMQIGIPGMQPPGYPTKYWNGSGVSDARVYVKGADKLVTPEDIRVMPNPRYTVAKMLAGGVFHWSHRGGGDNWPEMTLHAYTQSILWGAKCLEISVHRTTDGVWVGSHDSSTLRMTGVDLTIASSTWAQIKDLTVSASVTDNPAQPGRSLMKMVDIFELYAQSHVIIVDNKAVVDTTGFLNLMEQYDPTHEHLIFKGYRGSTTAPNMARARGFTTWGYMYDDDAVNSNIDLSCWDILGLNYNATQANWTAIKAHGKPVVAHIINSATAAATALSKGADGLQCSNVKQVIPRIL